MDHNQPKAVRKLPAMTWFGTTALTVTTALGDLQTVHEKLALIAQLRALLKLQEDEIFRRAREGTKAKSVRARRAKG
jgi:hypothetical protein